MLDQYLLQLFRVAHRNAELRAGCRGPVMMNQDWNVKLFSERKERLKSRVGGLNPTVLIRQLTHAPKSFGLIFLPQNTKVYPARILHCRRCDEPIRGRFDPAVDVVQRPRTQKAQDDVGTVHRFQSELEYVVRCLGL
jgi:hypothetical protein